MDGLLDTPLAGDLAVHIQRNPLCLGGIHLDGSFHTYDKLGNSCWHYKSGTESQMLYPFDPCGIGKQGHWLMWVLKSSFAAATVGGYYRQLSPLGDFLKEEPHVNTME
ncbi:hypothetical protein HAX54_053098 [Datura stramonium]|uniref:Uncharacterized protein n=1 Tax=Datura stramonium TaxID=4076 RepID=A0ABS8RRU2_DATST|nr:hypothetical protein [Datura stramonium]